jgi:hypothetical protein
LVDLLLGNLAFVYKIKKNMACRGLFRIFLIARQSQDRAVGIAAGNELDDQGISV